MSAADSHRLVFSGSVLPAKNLVLFNVQRIFAPFPVCAFHVPSITDNMHYNQYFQHFTSANEKSGTPGRSSSKRTHPRKVKKPAIYGPVPPSVPKIRFRPSAVNGSAQIHQGYKKTISLYIKTAPASCYGNRGGSFALFMLFQALTQLLAGVLDRSLGGCQNYRAFATVICRFFNTLCLQRTASLY